MKKIPIVIACFVVVAGYYFLYKPVHSKALAHEAAVIAQVRRTNNAQQLENKLTAAWKQTLANNPPDGNVDIALYDPANGATVQYSNATPSHSFITASVIKLSILETMLLQNQKAGTNGITPSQMQYAAPMIEDSDNDSASALWTEVGGSRAVNGLYQQIGAKDSTASDQHWGWSTTSAADQLNVIEQIAYPKLLSMGSVAAANNLLAQVESDESWGVSAGVPSGVTVRLKNGWLDPDDTNSNGWVVNSVGYVGGNGIDYTIAVLTDENSAEQDGINTIQALSTDAWNTVSAVDKS